MGVLTFLGIVFIFGIVTAQNELQVTPRVSRVFLREGDSYKMSCQANKDDISLEWETPEGFTAAIGYASNSIIIYDEQEQPKSIKGYRANLTIANHQIAGTYKCVEAKKDTKAVQETYPVEFYTLNEVVENAIFDEKDTVTLSCMITVEGFKVDSPVWKKNGTLIKDVVTDGSKLEPDNEKLIITGVMRSDAGLYTAEFPLTDGSFEDTYVCNVELKASPLVLDFEKSKNLIEDENLELQCKVLGYPAPLVRWQKDGNDIDGNSRVTMMDSHGVKNSTLKINQIVFDDAGDYTCIAISDEQNFTDSKKTITVRVKDRYAALWPFLGIVGEVIVLCTIIFIYEKRRSRQAEQEDAGQEETDGAAADRSEGLRHRNTTANNPRA